MRIHNKVFASIFWKGFESGGAAFIQFIIQIVLSRILTPEDFGISSITSMFIFLLHNLLQNGFTKFLVQKKEVDEVDYSTTFLASFIVSIVFGLLVFIVAPFVGGFYQSESLVPMLRIVCVLAVVGSYSAIQNAMIARDLLFKKQFIASISSVIISGVVAVYLAMNGYGVWSILIHQVMTVFLTSVFLGFMLRWVPIFRFSKDSFGLLVSFAWPLFVTNVWEWLFMNLRPLLIGRFYSTATLGYYNRANQFPVITMNIMSTAIQSVLLPVFSQRQTDLVSIKRLSGYLYRITSLVFFPIMIGMALVARPVIILLLTEKWAIAIPMMQILCIGYIFSGLNTLQLEVMYSLGEVGILLKVQYVRMIIGLLLIIATLRYGILAFCIGGVVENMISVCINCVLLKKQLGYDLKKQFRDMLSGLPSVLVMLLVVGSVSFIYQGSLLVLLLIQVFLGIVSYTTMTFLVNRETIQLTKALIQ